jgi:hypothetical protein
VQAQYGRFRHALQLPLIHGYTSSCLMGFTTVYDNEKALATGHFDHILKEV